jgi:DNA-binding transcriptional regulator YiaG
MATAWLHNHYSVSIKERQFIAGVVLTVLNYIVYNTGMSNSRKTARERWDRASIQALRQHLGLTQSELSEKLGTRQQTISEWETGMYRPRGASATLLSLVAEKAGFNYDASRKKNI